MSISKILKNGGDSIDKIFTSDDERLSKAEVLMRIDSKNQLAQLAYQAEELKTNNVFISGWRPAMGWISAISLGGLMFYYLVIKTIYPDLPDINLQVLELLNWIVPILFGIRSAEKLLPFIGMKRK